MVLLRDSWYSSWKRVLWPFVVPVAKVKTEKRVEAKTVQHLYRLEFRYGRRECCIRPIEEKEEVYEEVKHDLWKMLEMLCCFWNRWL